MAGWGAWGARLSKTGGCLNVMCSPISGHTPSVHARRCHARSAGLSGVSLSGQAIMQKAENRMSAVRFLRERGGSGESSRPQDVTL